MVVLLKSRVRSAVRCLLLNISTATLWKWHARCSAASSLVNVERVSVYAPLNLLTTVLEPKISGLFNQDNDNQSAEPFLNYVGIFFQSAEYISVLRHGATDLYNPITPITYPHYIISHDWYQIFWLLATQWLQTKIYKWQTGLTAFQKEIRLSTVKIIKVLQLILIPSILSAPSLSVAFKLSLARGVTQLFFASFYESYF